MSGGRFFLDTNVLVYSFLSDSLRKKQIAEDLVRDAGHLGRGVISYQVVQEFFNVAFTRFATPMSQGDALLYFSSVLRPLLGVTFSAALLIRAIRIRDELRTSWYDALIVAAALESECEILFSEDFQHGQVIEGLKIQNPFLKT